MEVIIPRMIARVENPGIAGGGGGSGGSGVVGGSWTVMVIEALREFEAKSYTTMKRP